MRAKYLQYDLDGAVVLILLSTTAKTDQDRLYRGSWSFLNSTPHHLTSDRALSSRWLSAPPMATMNDAGGDDEDNTPTDPERRT